MDIEHVMTRCVDTCDPRESVNRAAQVMWEHDCSCVPVVDGHHKLVGILTQRDIAMTAYTQGKPLAEIAVTIAMSHRVLSIQEHASIEEAEQAIAAFGVRRLPVIDAAGHLIGMLTRSDLARARREDDELHARLAEREPAAAVEPQHG